MKPKNIKEIQNHQSYKYESNKNIIYSELGGHLPSLMERLFENKNNNEKRK